MNPLLYFIPVLGALFGILVGKWSNDELKYKNYFFGYLVFFSISFTQFFLFNWIYACVSILIISLIFFLKAKENGMCMNNMLLGVSLVLFKTPEVAILSSFSLMTYSAILTVQKENKWTRYPSYFIGLIIGLIISFLL